MSVASNAMTAIINLSADCSRQDLDLILTSISKIDYRSKFFHFESTLIVDKMLTDRDHNIANNVIRSLHYDK